MGTSEEGAAAHYTVNTVYAYIWWNVAVGGRRSEGDFHGAERGNILSLLLPPLLSHTQDEVDREHHRG